MGATQAANKIEMDIDQTKVRNAEEWLAEVDPDFLSAVIAAVEARENWIPSARKSGRTKERPYVPIQKTEFGTTQILNRAYATREEAIACAERVLRKARVKLMFRLLTPDNARPFREMLGLPRDITNLVPKQTLAEKQVDSVKYPNGAHWLDMASELIEKIERELAQQ